MKKITLFLLLITVGITYSQVGIGTTTPSSMLDIRASNTSTPTNQDGILIPRISAFPATDPAALQNGMLVFLTTTNKFYFWNHPTTTWIPFVREIDDLRDGKSNDDKSIFLGVGAGAAYSTTNRNLVGIGNFSLNSVTTGFDNVGVGANSLRNITTTFYNTAVGSNALEMTTTGQQNVAIGYNALRANTFREYSVAVGAFALENNVDGFENTGIGANTLRSNTSGSRNVGLGTSTLTDNTTGGFNMAIGSLAMRRNTTGGFNAAVGAEALNFNLVGNNNTAVGFRSLYNNLTSNNIAVGYQAAYVNTSGTNLTAIGYDAMYSNTTGNNNVAIGRQSNYYNNIGNDNTTLGYRSHWSVSAPKVDFLTAIGSNSLAAGIRATSLGYLATVTGNNSTSLGSNTNVNGINSTAIGYQATVTGDNQIHLGNASITAIRGQVAFSTYSDKRIKDNIRENVVGLGFINRLRPVTYNLNVDKQNTFLRVTDASNDKKYESEKIVRTGFIAQEVDNVAKQVGYNFSGVQKPKNNKELYSLSYAEFVVPLVKGMQEQSKIIENLLKKVEVLTKRVEALEKKK